ncbi:MAG: 50S ribosomal protein L10 [Akkermansiaceae bacterium]|nr:50S ribosomal protein L10 [Armatimonadota bacterium]
MAKKTKISHQIKKKPITFKQNALSTTAQMMQDSQAVILTEYRGLTVPQVNDIRGKLKGSGADFSVIKNTLFKRAANELSISDAGLDAALNGPTAAVFATGDPVAAAKAVSEYIASVRNSPFKVKGGVVGGKFATPAQIEQLSKVPPKEVLISQMLGAFNSPIAGFVGTLNGIVSNFVYTLQAIADKQTSGDSAAA